MNPTDAPPITLSSLAGGACEELFQAGMKEVLSNIRDPNTDAEAKRRVVVAITFSPDKDREVGQVEITCSTKMAGRNSATTRVFVGHRPGQGLVAVEYNPTQRDLFPDEGKPKLVAMADRQQANAVATSERVKKEGEQP